MDGLALRLLFHLPSSISYLLASSSKNHSGPKMLKLSTMTCGVMFVLPGTGALSTRMTVRYAVSAVT